MKMPAETKVYIDGLLAEDLILDSQLSSTTTENIGECELSGTLHDSTWRRAFGFKVSDPVNKLPEGLRKGWRQ